MSFYFLRRLKDSRDNEFEDFTQNIESICIKTNYTYDVKSNTNTGKIFMEILKHERTMVMELTKDEFRSIRILLPDDAFTDRRNRNQFANYHESRIEMYKQENNRKRTLKKIYNFLSAYELYERLDKNILSTDERLGSSSVASIDIPDGPPPLKRQRTVPDNYDTDRTLTDNEEEN